MWKSHIVRCSWSEPMLLLSALVTDIYAKWGPNTKTHLSPQGSSMVSECPVEL